jgi:hypothetical protein
MEHLKELEPPKRNKKTIKIKPEKLAKVKKSYEGPSALLLSYTYFFGAQSLKYISIGFSTVFDFAPILYLNHIGVSYIPISAIEWMSIYINIEAINKMFQRDVNNKIGVIDAGRGIKIRFNPKSNTITMYNNFEGTISLSYNEWMYILNIMEYINSVIFWYQSTVNEVKSYYNDYILKCNEHNVLSLDASMYFNPTRCSNIRYNYTRLFYEFPLLCPLKLRNDVAYLAS